MDFCTEKLMVPRGSIHLTVSTFVVQGEITSQLRNGVDISQQNGIQCNMRKNKESHSSFFICFILFVYNEGTKMSTDSSQMCTEHFKI